MENIRNINPLKVDKAKIINLEKGMVPPQAIDLECAVLGAMMVDKKGVDEVMAIVNTPSVFYKDAHVHIFQAIQSLYNQGNPVDLLTVGAELRKLGLMELAGGDFYLIELTQKISSAAHIEFHTRLILQKYIARMVIAFNSQIIGLAYDEETDVFELLDRWQKEFDKVIDYTSTGRSTVPFSGALNDLKRSVERLTANKEVVQLVGVDTGFMRTNKYTGGYRNQDLVILGARPGMGKTAKAIKTAIANVKKGIPVGFISGEMSIEQLTARAVAIDTNFHLNQLLKKGFEKPEYFQTLQYHIDRMKSYPLLIDDSGKMDISDVINIAKTWHRKDGIKLLIIDYLQLMKDRALKGRNRNDELSEISRRLKMLAKELNIPIIALVQVNRECEKRGSSKRPLISDIKDCGSIEQDADIVEFIYRPEYYKLEMCEEEYEAHTAALIDLGANSEIIYAKYRGGATGVTLLKWIGDKTKFADVEDPEDMVDVADSNVVIPKALPSEAFDSGPVNIDENDNDFPF